MQFFPYEPFDNNKGQHKIWAWLKKAFKDEPGVAYYRYPVFTKNGQLNKEPDVLILHRDLGLWVFESKGCYINNIDSIQGHDWKMKNWYRENDAPVNQAEDGMFAIKNILEKRRETRNLITSLNFLVALPFVKKQEWESKGFHKLPCTQGVILLYEDLTPSAIKEKLVKNSRSPQRNLTDKEWELVKSVLGGTLPSSQPRSIPTGTSSDNPIRIINAIQSQIKTLDETQRRIAFEVPNGPQRLRGLAGTGKTVLLAKRVAKMHASHPDWKIAFVFFTRSLYKQILELINLYYREMTEEEPNWEKIKVLHSWGAKEQEGFYRDLVFKCGGYPKSVSRIEEELGERLSPGKAFEYACDRLEKEQVNIPYLYDAVVIDEGQDLPPSFYRLAYKTLREPKRLYWAYDEAQGLNSLIIPNSESIFGKNSEGKLIVNLSGSYEGGILKSHKMNRCYRTPRLLLMTAHAINMGLFRKEGVLQGVSNQEDWKILGYEVIKGDFTPQSIKAGNIVTITRPSETSPHAIDRDNFDWQESLNSLLTTQTFTTEFEEREWIAKQVTRDIQQGFKPCDIIITALCGDDEKDYFSTLKDILANRGIKSYIAGVDGDRNIFQKEDHVTISNIYRAKGNEAWKVYACRFEYATIPLSWKKGENELHKRNEAFVALTRTRSWCVITGQESPIFDELQQAINQYPNFHFPAFNKQSLKRITEDETSENVIEQPELSSGTPKILKTKKHQLKLRQKMAKLD